MDLENSIKVLLVWLILDKGTFGKNGLHTFANN